MLDPGQLPRPKSDLSVLSFSGLEVVVHDAPQAVPDSDLEYLRPQYDTEGLIVRRPTLSLPSGWQRNKWLYRRRTWLLGTLGLVAIAALVVGLRLRFAHKPASRPDSNKPPAGQSTATNTTTTTTQTGLPGLAAVFSEHLNTTTIFHRATASSNITQTACILAATPGDKNNCTTTPLSYITDASPHTPLTSIGTPKTPVLLYLSTNNSLIRTNPLTRATSVLAANLNPHVASKLAAVSADGTANNFFVLYQHADLSLRQLSQTGTESEAAPNASPGTYMGIVSWPLNLTTLSPSGVNITTSPPWPRASFSLNYLKLGLGTGQRHVLVKRVRSTDKKFRDLGGTSGAVFSDPETSLMCSGWTDLKIYKKAIQCWTSREEDGRLQGTNWFHDKQTPFVTIEGAVYEVPGRTALRNGRTPVVGRKGWALEDAGRYEMPTSHFFFEEKGMKVGESPVLGERVESNSTGWGDGDGMVLED